MSNSESKLTQWLLLGLLVILSGCSQAVGLLCFNNSGETVIIYEGLRTNGVKVEIAPGQSAHIASYDLFKIRRGEKEYVYGRISWSRSMASKGRFPTVNVQIEADGAIVFSGPQASGITTNLPPQPAGFPVRPR